MAVKCINFHGKENPDICEFVCDNLNELFSELPTITKKGTGEFANFDHYASLGSTAIVGNEGNTSIYMLFSDGWQEV